ncbi:dentin sialophosphoprotein-like [Leptidea sinapis]|uniref:dentin sialophosphoprotein-like n=1 Tax=Leptidea sinapis TaxID=189913 RepID=UPI0021C41A39|nr:dentin sialophosphoprotein-like [Leptidea sinapis]
MRYLILLFTFGSLIINNTSKPIKTAETESELDDSEYEGVENSGANDDVREDQVQEYEKGNEKKNSFRSKTVDMDENNPSDYKVDVEEKSDEEEGVDEENAPHRSNSNQNLGNNEEREDHEDVKQVDPNTRSYKDNNLRTDDNIGNHARSDSSFNTNEFGGFVLENNQIKDQDELVHNNGRKAPEHYPALRNYYNKVNMLRKRPLHFSNSNRDRRQIPNQNNDYSATDSNIADKKDQLENINDDSEAIKRNIKKLSREDLENLLSSLSDDKKVLLKKIIDNKLESVSKRDITKKSGAVEENNGLESSNSMGSNAGSVSPSTVLADTTKTESNEVSSAKNSDNDNSSTKSDSKDEIKDMNELVKPESEDPAEQTNSNSELKENNPEEDEFSKNENKREINSDQDDGHADITDAQRVDSIKDLPQDNEATCVKDDYWSELLKDESQFHNTNKRETDLKSLEESFSNSNSILYKEMPLVRVKRTNSALKRKSNHSGNMKVPYFPEAANDEADENEKSEFDDSGIYDQSFNYDKITKGRNLQERIDVDNDHCNNNNLKSSKYIKIKPSIDPANLGSDTDNILSNVEGVDDNSMYNGRLRNKRTKNINDERNIENNEMPPNNVETVNSDDKNNDLSDQPNDKYQEIDAFGPISRDSNEDVSRYKRIRRLKLSG